MNIMLIIEILIIAIILFGLFLITSHIFFNKIYLPYKQISQPMTATELFDTLSSMINTELAIYEKNIFKTQGNVLSSATYENYYNEICYQILGDLSPEFFVRSRYYMTDEKIADLVARSVQSYLSDKIATGGIDIQDDNKENLL